MDEAQSSFLRRKIVHEWRLAGTGLEIPDWLGEVKMIVLPAAYCEWSGFDMRTVFVAIIPHPVDIDDANAATLGEI
jgi:hypothetical protein